jgi:hypothetical protein
LKCLSRSVYTYIILKSHNPKLHNPKLHNPELHTNPEFQNPEFQNLEIIIKKRTGNFYLRTFLINN